MSVNVLSRSNKKTYILGAKQGPPGATGLRGRDYAIVASMTGGGIPATTGWTDLVVTPDFYLANGDSGTYSMQGVDGTLRKVGNQYSFSRTTAGSATPIVPNQTAIVPGTSRQIILVLDNIPQLKARPVPPTDGYVAKLNGNWTLHDMADMPMYLWVSTSTRNDPYAIRPNAVAAGSAGRWEAQIGKQAKIGWADGVAGGNITPALPGAAQYLWFNSMTLVIDGDYTYYGPKITTLPGTSRIQIIGDSYETSRLAVVNNDWLFEHNGLLNGLVMRGLMFDTATCWGYLHCTSNSYSVTNFYSIEKCFFRGYTKCAIGANFRDNPYWRIRDNIFDGGAPTSGTAIALRGSIDASLIEGNEFFDNLIGIKIGGGDGSCNPVIRDNSFFNFTGATLGQYDIWIVPEATRGVLLEDNKFGNENIRTDAIRVLIANENPANGDFATNGIDNTNPAGLVSNIRFLRNKVTGIAGMQRAVICTYVSNILSYFVYEENLYDGDSYPYILEFLGNALPQKTGLDSKRVRIDVGTTYGAARYPRFCNLPIGPILTKTDALACTNSIQYSQGLDAGYSQLIKNTESTDWGNIANWPVVNLAKTIISGPYNNNEAIQLSQLGGAFAACFGKLNTVSQNRLLWIGIDLACISWSPDLFDIRIVREGSQDIYANFSIELRDDSQWRTYLWPTMISADSQYLSSMYLQLTFPAGGSTVIRVANPRAYHANQPIAAAVPVGIDTIVSGAMRQNGAPCDIEISLPVSFNPTASQAATCVVTVGRNAISGQIIVSESYPPGSVAGILKTLIFRIPSGSFYNVTLANATAGSAAARSC